MAPRPLLALRRRRAGRGSLRALCQHPSHPSVYRLGCAGSVPPSRLVRKPCWPMKTMNRNLTAGTEHYPLRKGGLLKSWRSRVWNAPTANWGRRSLPSSLCTRRFCFCLCRRAGSRGRACGVGGEHGSKLVNTCGSVWTSPMGPFFLYSWRAFARRLPHNQMGRCSVRPSTPSIRHLRRPERAWFGCRVLYAARIGHCRA